jgi:hypothetical protein
VPVADVIRAAITELRRGGYRRFHVLTFRVDGLGDNGRGMSLHRRGTTSLALSPTSPFRRAPRQAPIPARPTH